MPKKGDIVRFLNAIGGGRVSRTEGRIVYVEDEDGFETPVLQNELVVVTPAETQAARIEESEPKAPAPSAQQATPQPAPKPAPAAEEPRELPVCETDYGDRLNVVLAYEPHNIKELSTTHFDAVVVNDSNYWLSASYLTSPTGEEWTLVRQAEIEPNMQLVMEEVERPRLSEMTHVALQFTAYKKGKPFERKLPVWVEQKLDMTKFFKLHCFKPNIYFDNQVIAVDILRDDKPVTQPQVDTKALEESLRRKQEADRSERKPVQRRPLKGDKDAPLEVDLHIGELLDTTRGMSAGDILNHQIDAFRRVMDENIANHGRKIVFIHGKGEGVLRQALMKELTHRYKGHDVQDASFREYGFGATQVTIR